MSSKPRDDSKGEESLYLDYEFESNFYSYIAESENYEIISIPDFDSYIPSDEEYKIIIEDCKKRNTKLIYRISNGKYAIVYGGNIEKVGIVPEDNPHGFLC